ncbi:MAG TPA: glycosyltransferase [Gemmataceae bacterium]|nr:glycosyltransferase [Gemmataceae bacterium]
MPTIVQLAASIFLGGPERQMLGLARALPREYTTVFVSFSENGRCRPFLEEARRSGFRAVELEHDTPRLLGAKRELQRLLADVQADFVCPHGYKTDLLGLWSARRLGIPVIAVSHGWTAQDLKVRLYEKLDRFCLRRMDRVVCVSRKQADKVIASGTPAERVSVIRDAVDVERFKNPDPVAREKLCAFFAKTPRRIVGAAGRLSPEKGFSKLVEAATTLVPRDNGLGFVLFGDGPLRDALAHQVRAYGLEHRFVLAGHRTDLDALLPFLDLLVLPSYTEGLPNVVLEAFAAGVPVVATAVGGTPELVEDGVNGYLVAAGDPVSLAERIARALSSEPRRRDMGARGKLKVLKDFTFPAQSALYQELFANLKRPAVATGSAVEREFATQPLHIGEDA